MTDYFDVHALCVQGKLLSSTLILGSVFSNNSIFYEITINSLSARNSDLHIPIISFQSNRLYFRQ